MAPPVGKLFTVVSAKGFILSLFICLGPLNYVNQFLSHLPPDRKPVDTETLSIIQRQFGIWLMTVFSANDAVKCVGDCRGYLSCFH